MARILTCVLASKGAKAAAGSGQPGVPPGTTRLERADPLARNLRLVRQAIPKITCVLPGGGVTVLATRGRRVLVWWLILTVTSISSLPIWSARDTRCPAAEAYRTERPEAPPPTWTAAELPHVPMWAGSGSAVQSAFRSVLRTTSGRADAAWPTAISARWPSFEDCCGVRPASQSASGFSKRFPRGLAAVVLGIPQPTLTHVHGPFISKA